MVSRATDLESGPQGVPRRDSREHAFAVVNFPARPASRFWAFASRRSTVFGPASTTGRGWALVAILLLGAGCAGSKPGGSAAPGMVSVLVGAEATEAAGHDISVDALEAGRTSFSVEGAQGAHYTVELTAEQVADLLAGSTVMVEGAGERGAEQIRVSIEKEKEDEGGFFGW
jgi:hypothetical protein